MLLSSMHLLIVDDEYAARRTLTELLEDEGYEVGSAENGAEALDVLVSGIRPQLILLDFSMPVMNGPKFLFHKDADPTLRDIPVVICTTLPRLSSPEGVAEVLNKPFRLARLLEVIRRYCGPPPAGELRPLPAEVERVSYLAEEVDAHAS